jgi:hypothetical protein
VNAEKTALISARIDQLDDMIYAAERTNDVPEQIKCLKSRSSYWYKWAEMLRVAGRDTTAALTSARRDETEAAQLEAGL